MPHSPEFISEHGDNAGQSWTSQGAVYPASQEELTHGGQFLWLLSAWICQRGTWSDHPHFCDAKDAICALEICVHGQQVPGCASTTNHVSIFGNHVQSILYSLIHMGVLDTDLIGISENGSECAISCKISSRKLEIPREHFIKDRHNKGHKWYGPNRSRRY